MDKLLQQKLVEIIGELQQAVVSTKDFVLSQLPDIVQQYIHYTIVSDLFWIVVCLALMIVCIWASFNWFDESDDGGILLITGIPFTLSAIAFLVNLTELLKVWLAPKVFLLQALSGLIKG